MFQVNLKKLREGKGLSQAKFAKEIGVSQSTVGMWESGKNKPEFSALLKIADYFNVTTDILTGIETETQKRSTRVPVLGTVQAGIPIDAIEEIIDYEELKPEMMAHGEEYFALQVKGSSMEPRMREGDVVIVKKQPDVNHDDTAIVLVNGGEATIKRVLKSESGIMLAPNNPAYETKFYSNKEIADLPVVILGKVVELRAKF